MLFFFSRGPLVTGWWFWVFFSRESFPMILVANKVDLMHLRKITREQGREMATKHNVSLWNCLIGRCEPHYRHSELNSLLIWSWIKAFLLQFNICNYIFDYYQVVAMQSTAQKGQFIIKNRISAAYKTVSKLWPSWNCVHKVCASGEKWEILRMRGKNALTWSEKAKSGIRKHIQVSVRSELVKDNEVMGLLSLHISGPPY